MKFVLPLVLAMALPAGAHDWKEVGGSSAHYADEGWFLVGSSSSFTDKNNSLFVVTFWRERPNSGRYIRCKDATVGTDTISVCEIPAES
jgi:hypothetical protein